jgi:hypothetical protein
MHVAALRLELRLSDCTARHHKRRRMREIVDRLHRHFNVSLAEVDLEDLVDRSVLGVSVVAPSRREALESVERVAEAVQAHPLVEVVQLVLHEF